MHDSDLYNPVICCAAFFSSAFNKFRVFLFWGPSTYARKVKKSSNQRQRPKLEFRNLSCTILTPTTLYFVAPLFFLLPSINFEFFCVQDLPDMLEKCITAQIKDKDLNFKLETSPAWVWPPTALYLGAPLFWLLATINFEFFFVLRTFQIC